MGNRVLSLRLSGQEREGWFVKTWKDALAWAVLLSVGYGVAVSLYVVVRYGKDLPNDAGLFSFALANDAWVLLTFVLASVVAGVLWTVGIIGWGVQLGTRRMRQQLIRIEAALRAGGPMAGRAAEGPSKDPDDLT